MRTFLSSIIAVLTASISFGQGLFGNESNAFMLMPAQAISGAHTHNVQISPSGRLILYRQVPVGTPESLFGNPKEGSGKWMVYDRIAKSNRVVKLPDVNCSVVMLSDDQNVYYEIQGPSIVRGFVNLNGGSPIPIDIGETQMIYLGSETFAKFLIGVLKEESLVAFYPNGTVSTVKIDRNYRILWVMSGDANSLTFMARPKEKAAQRQVKAVLNRATNSLTYGQFAEGEIETYRSMSDHKAPTFYATPSGDMDYVGIADDFEIPTAALTGAATTQNPVKKDKSQTLIPKLARLGPVGGEVAFSQQYDFVVYQDAGALLVREIKPVDKLTAERLSLADLQAKLLSKVKQVGLGFLIYGADNDDILPGAESWETKLMPYMKNRDMMNNFNYTFRGGNIGDVSNPSQTELGFALGPGGRAVVYLDGHAKWIPDA